MSVMDIGSQDEDHGKELGRQTVNRSGVVQVVLQVGEPSSLTLMLSYALRELVMTPARVESGIALSSSSSSSISFWSSGSSAFVGAGATGLFVSSVLRVILDSLIYPWDLNFVPERLAPLGR